MRFGSPGFLTNSRKQEFEQSTPFVGSVTSNAVPTFAMNSNTSLFSSLNGATNFKASPIEIYIGGITNWACNLSF